MNGFAMIAVAGRSRAFFVVVVALQGVTSFRVKCVAVLSDVGDVTSRVTTAIMPLQRLCGKYYHLACIASQPLAMFWQETTEDFGACD
jgi:hypothetical protein